MTAQSFSTAAELPAPVSGQRHEINSPAGRLTYYAASPEAPGPLPPLLLLHSINAAGSAYEVSPLYEHYRQSRPVYALELPGFGHSDRSKRRYTPRLMTDAVLAATREIQEVNGRRPIDAIALSLSSEFLARAINEMPLAFRSAALISPTGFRGRDVGREGTRGMPWLHAVLEGRPWSAGLFSLLSSRASIRFFLKKTFGSDNYDRGLADYDYITTHQPGAEHAPYDFVSGFLFSTDALRLYQALMLPVWISHGVRGDFVDYNAKGSVAGRANFTITVFQTGALPHFEAKDEFIKAYDAFLAGVGTNDVQP
jgi:pimeloyl-ACP methyl ester carboxylesterase